MDSLLIYLYNYFSCLENELDSAIMNRLSLINRFQLESDSRQLAELHDLFVKKEFLKTIVKRVFDILRMFSLF